ncbi:hypothetical protein [Enterococcus sp. LJL90]
MKAYEELPLSRLSDESLDQFITMMGHQFDTTSEKNIQQRVLSAGEKLTWLDKIRCSKRNLTLVVALTSFFIIPGTVYGASKVWQTYFSQHNFSSLISITNQDKKQEKEYRLEVNYLPEGLRPISQNEGEVPAKFYNPDVTDATISTLLLKIDEGQTDLETLYTDTAEEMVLAGRKVWMINQKANEASDSLNRTAYVLFEEEGYVLQMYIGNDIPESELLEVVRNLDLVPAGGGPASNSYLISEFAEETEKVSAEAPCRIPTDSDLIKKVGEEQHFSLNQQQDDKTDFALTVNDVTVSDNLFEVENADSDWSVQDSFNRLKEDNLVDDTGYFLPYTATLYNRGDGKDTLDTVAAQTQDQMKLVKLNVTLKNLSSATFSDFYFQANASILTAIDGFYQPKYLLDWEQQYAQIGYQNSLDIVYLSNHGEGKGYLNIGSISGQEAITFEFGYLVPASDVTSLFLDAPAYNYEDDYENQSERVKLFE